MISMTTTLRHLAWADDRLFRSLAALPPEALAASYAGPEWTVAHLARHIVSGAEWYRYCLIGERWTDLALPTGPADLDALREHLAGINAVLLAQGDEADELLTFEDEDGDSSAMRSMLLAQACYHSTEHRTQIACALEVSGISGLTLDDFDLWSFTAAAD